MLYNEDVLATARTEAPELSAAITSLAAFPFGVVRRHGLRNC
jgi:hypothetical protein